MTTMIDPTRFPPTWATQLPQLRAAHEAVREQERAQPQPGPPQIGVLRPSAPLLLLRLGAEAPAIARVAAVLLERTRPLDATEVRGLLRLLRDLSHGENALLHALRDAGLIGPHLWSTLVVPAQEAATREHQRRAGALRSGLVRAGLALAPLAAGLAAGLWIAGPIGGAMAMGVQLLIGLVAMPQAASRAERGQLERTERLGLDLTPPTSEVEAVIDRLQNQPAPSTSEIPAELSLLRLLAETRAALGPSPNEAPADREVAHRLHELVERTAHGTGRHEDFAAAWSRLRSEASQAAAIRQRLHAIQRGATVPSTRGAEVAAAQGAERAASNEAVLRTVEATVGPWLERAQGMGLALRARVTSVASRTDGSTVIQGTLTHGWLRRDRGTFLVTLGPAGSIASARSSIRLNATAAGELAKKAVERELERTASRTRRVRILDARDVGRHGFEVLVASGERIGALNVTREGIVDSSSTRWFAAE